MRKLCMGFLLLMMSSSTITTHASESSFSHEIGVYMSCPATQIDETIPSEKPEYEIVKPDDVAGNVQTGDNSDVFAYAGICSASIGAMFITMYLQKKGGKHEK